MVDKQTQYQEGADNLEGDKTREVPCRHCEGGGYLFLDGERDECPDCGGRGMVLPTRTYRKEAL